MLTNRLESCVSLKFRLGFVTVAFNLDCGHAIIDEGW